MEKRYAYITQVVFQTEFGRTVNLDKGTESAKSRSIS